MLEMSSFKKELGDLEHKADKQMKESDTGNNRQVS